MSVNTTPKRVCVTGLGHIGLPTACILAASGYIVHGVDNDKKVVNRLKSTDCSNPEPNLKNLLDKVLRNGSLEISTLTTPANIHVIAVPTPLDHGNLPDISNVNAAVEAIRQCLRPYDLILVESTCPIGTTQAIAQKLKETCSEIFVAYCPERVIPGNILHELIHNDRVVGGVDHASTEQAALFYRSFVRGDVLTSNAQTAEAVKLAENTYRDINLAFANELSMIADRIGLDPDELIRLANRHPRVQILQPGPGVGGHCIAVDPWFLIAAAPDLAALALKAREINLKKTEWVIEKVRTAIRTNDAKIVACLGLTYKPNVSDIRQSPALRVVQTLQNEVEVLCVDPHIPNTEKLHDAIARAEVIVGLVAHQSFLNISPDLLKDKIVLDFAGIFI